jgi:hypothetical protein
MLATIEFDDNATLDANEIQNEIGIRMLTAKFAAFEPPAAQILPEYVFGIRGGIAQPALQMRVKNLLVSLTFHSCDGLKNPYLRENPSPPNPPLEGEGFDGATAPPP